MVGKLNRDGRISRIYSLYNEIWQNMGAVSTAGLKLKAVYQGNLAVRVAEINKYAKIAPDFGSPSRRAKGSILSICDFWCNAEGGLKDKSAVADGFICFRGPMARPNKKI